MSTMSTSNELSSEKSLIRFTCHNCLKSKGTKKEENKFTSKTFEPDELRQALMPTFEKLYEMEPESFPFRQPVDQLQQIQDYFDIIERPMDLSTIKRKLDNGQYQDPWQYVEDVWLMFDNAWLTNRKTSRVYRYCSKLAEVFQQEIDPVMQSLGYCCGRKVLCYGNQLCSIPRDAKYYSYQNRYTYCRKCFSKIPCHIVSLRDDPTQPPSIIRKDQFTKMNNNNHLKQEPFVECLDCGRKLHQICALQYEHMLPEGSNSDHSEAMETESDFYLDSCSRMKDLTLKETQQAKVMPTPSQVQEKLRCFINEHNIPQDAADELLKIIKKFRPDLIELKT